MSEHNGDQGSDPVSDFQRWLMRAGARGLGREVGDKVRGAFGQAPHTDVWEAATTEAVGEAPECLWCPVCRAARKFRDSGPGLGGTVAGVGDTLAGFAQDAVGLFESAMRAGAAGSARQPGQTRPAGRPSAAPEPAADAGQSGAAAESAGEASTPRAEAESAAEASKPSVPEPAAGVGQSAADRPAQGGGQPGGENSDDGTVIVTGVTGWPVTHPEHQDREAADEGGDGDERREPGQGPAGDQRDHQVGWPAE